MTGQARPIVVRRAVDTDAGQVAAVLAIAFGRRGDLREHLVPDNGERSLMYPPYFAMFADHALRHGRVDITGDGKGVLVSYLRGGTRVVPEVPDYDRRMQRIFGVYADGFRELDAALAARHPDDVEHCYVQFVAVLPDLHRRGYGSALLDQLHQRADQQRLPCYLESTGPGTTSLYDRHGYEAGKAFQVWPQGAELTPMWRPAASLSQQTAAMTG